MKMILFAFICSTAFISNVVVKSSEDAQVTTQTQVTQGNNVQGFDVNMGELTDNLNVLIIGCSNYLPMVDAYMRSQNDNPDFLSGDTDVITLQVSVDSTFNACKSIINVVAAYQLVINEYQ